MFKKKNKLENMEKNIESILELVKNFEYSIIAEINEKEKIKYDYFSIKNERDTLLKNEKKLENNARELLEANTKLHGLLENQKREIEKLETDLKKLGKKCSKCGKYVLASDTILKGRTKICKECIKEGKID